MRIVIITNLYPLPWEPNRASFNRQQFARLAELHEVSILVPVAFGDYWKHRHALRAANTDSLRYVCFAYTPKMFYGAFGRFMDWSMRLFGGLRWAKARRPDVVYGSWAFPDGYAAAQIAQSVGVPYIIKVHGSDINLLEAGSGRARATRTTCQQAANMIAVSEALAQKLHELGVSKQNITRIYNGVDAQLFYPERDLQAPYLVFVGNLKRDKGVNDLVEAYARYRQQGGVWPLKIVGGGAEHAHLKARIDALDLGAHIELLGPRPHHEAAAMMRAASGLVLPSYHEGVPNVLLEAASCGMPVLATTVGGIPEVVVPEVTGLLHAPGDIDALANGLHALSAPERWNEARITAHAAQFTWERNIAELDAVIQSCAVSR